MGDLNIKFDRFQNIYLMERHRLDSYKEWPYGKDSSCSIDKMAEAGFYWCGDTQEIDTVKCFVCGKTLTGWDPDDDPWKEHTKHAPQCQFVKYGRKEKDLTLAEFLNIFAMVAKNQVTHSINNIKRDLVKTVTDEWNTFRGDIK